MSTTTSLPEPTNQLVSVVNAILDSLILGLGADAALASAVSAAPVLANPFLSYLLRKVIAYFASIFDVRLRLQADFLLIRLQNDERKASYDLAIEKLKEQLSQGETNAAREKALKDAKDAIDRLVRRNK